MKKKILIGIIVLLVVALIGVGVWFLLSKPEKSEPNNNNQSDSQSVTQQNQTKILVEYSYINYAWGFQYKGMAFLRDGSILTWDSKNIKDAYKTYSTMDHEQWVLTYGTPSYQKLTDIELKTIEDNIATLEDTVTPATYTANDMGSYYINVWNMAGEKMLIMEGGDTTRENPTLNAKNIKEIIAKYVMQ